MTRTEQIIALLGSLYDYLPGPKTAHYGDLPGPAPTETADCTACGGAGTTGKRKRRCAACEGKGKVVVDGYTGKPVGTDKGKVRSAEPRAIDAELRRLAAAEQIRRGRLLDDPFAWEAERIRYRRAGSYSSLEAALESLRANEPDLCSLVMRCLVYRVSEPTGAAQDELERALAWISRRMPPEIRVPRWVGSEPPQVERAWPRDRRRNQATKERNERIIALGQEGMAGAQIAREVGCSAATVSRVLAAVSLAGTAAA